ncbi:TATA-box-binding protein [Nitrosopumilus sp.]|uniref:TATA-box-binding protein n=1 Tax=Nitrosopumilus sp. TaxID=2024843 RepID=UPI0029303430|nr:TATA-box-binding protein [Nitrosopumilus sp.]
MAQTKPHISIVNVVSSATTDQKLDLVEITKKFPDVEYHPDQFPGAVFRLDNPRTATLIFQTGNMVCTGATSEEMSIKAVNTVVQKLRRAKIKIKNRPPVTIQNIVSTINLGGRVSIVQAARTLPRSIYEPEQFPAVIHRMLDPKTVTLIFSTGKLVCTGARHEEEIHRSVNQIHSLLEEKNLMDYD